MCFLICWFRHSDAEGTKVVIEVYDASTVRGLLSVSLSQGGLLLFALLCGGDYDVCANTLNKIQLLTNIHVALGWNSRLWPKNCYGTCPFWAQ